MKISIQLTSVRLAHAWPNYQMIQLIRAKYEQTTTIIAILYLLPVYLLWRSRLVKIASSCSVSPQSSNLAVHVLLELHLQSSFGPQMYT